MRVGNRYIRKYMYRVADRAEVHRIPPKNLRSTYISLMADLGIQMSLIQKQVGHEAGSSVTSQHYIRVFDESLKKASLLLHNKLHDQNHNSPSFA